MSFRAELGRLKRVGRRKTPRQWDEQAAAAGLSGEELVAAMVASAQEITVKSLEVMVGLAFLRALLLKLPVSLPFEANVSQIRQSVGRGYSEMGHLIAAMQNMNHAAVSHEPGDPDCPDCPVCSPVRHRSTAGEEAEAK